MSLFGCSSTKVVVKEPPVYENERKGPPPWAPAHGYRAKYQYYYYPSASVYFDVGRRLYFFYQNDQWRVSASLPVGIRIVAGEYVVLEMDTDKPYQFHSDVTKRYPPGQVKKLGKEKSKGKWN
jgi:hypothetical protein